jgi:hypothetical protein
MSKEIDRDRANMLQLEAAMKVAAMGSVLDHLTMPTGEFLKLLAVSGVDLSAKCLRPVGEAE